jgi:hypothetical protein
MVGSCVRASSTVCIRCGGCRMRLGGVLRSAVVHDDLLAGLLAV